MAGVDQTGTDKSFGGNDVNPVDELGIPIVQKAKDLDKVAADNDPRARMSGQIGGGVETKAEADKVREETDPKDPEKADFIPPGADATLKDLGYTPLDSHPPLAEGDRIQGPHDRGNRKPTKAELEAGKRATENQLSREEMLEAQRQNGAIKDPPIDENAPKDKPADPRKVLEGRGIKFEKRQDQPA
jgi:hypothetical protein